MAEENTRGDSIVLLHSGAASVGAAQASALACLGGKRSSTRIDSLAVDISSPISGITVNYVSGKCGEGSASLAVTATDTLAFTAPGGSQGAGVEIANGETKILEDGGDVGKFISISRTSADALSGTATLTLTDTFNNAIGGPNFASDEASAGEDYYLCIFGKNNSSSPVDYLKYYLGTLGTQRTSDSSQLGASGAGTIGIGTGTFADWPESGFARITDNGGTLREIVYYSSRTTTALTVPATGRELFGTSAGAGAATDVVDAVPGMRIAYEAPSSGAVQTIADINTAPTGLTWKTGIEATDGPDIGTLASGDDFAIWIHFLAPEDTQAIAEMLRLITYSFEA
jgi:hypothetical protein